MARRPRILLADDHPGILEKATNLLQAEFEVVGRVTDGKAAIDAVFELQPDLVVLDITMPELDGFGAARELRRRGSPTKVVFLTMQQDQDYVAEAMESGGVGYVLKSRMYSDLVYAIAQALSGCKFVSPTTA
jgi:DNA-binding NarL/FixJ family response regulator